MANLDLLHKVLVVEKRNVEIFALSQLLELTFVVPEKLSHASTKRHPELLRIILNVVLRELDLGVRIPKHFNVLSQVRENDRLNEG